MDSHWYNFWDEIDDGENTDYEGCFPFYRKNEADKEIERLRKEKEWLLNEGAWDKYFMDEERGLQKDYKQKIIDKMQQALKEE